MHRAPLLELLSRHTPADATEATHLTNLRAFVAATPDCFERTHLAGHVTASAWITSPDGAQAVLLHHGKLNRWLQPGGHCDGDPDVAATALREAQEETGLTSLRFASPEILDTDIHPIPARPEAPAHLHYDVRFHLHADPAEAPANSHESREVRWLPTAALETLTTEESVLRLARKGRKL